MAKRPSTSERLERIEKVVASQQLEKIQNAPTQNAPERFENGLLGDAVGAGGGFGFPGNQGSPWTPTISTSETIFKNLRWYLVSNFRQMLSQAYVELGLVKTVCQVPVQDALRGGIEIKSKQLSPEQIEELQVSIDRDGDLETAGEAAIWNRLFGGAGILVLTDQDPEEELDVESIDEDTPLEFRAVDMWELTWDMQGSEGYDPTTQEEGFDFYSYYGEPVHVSRVMKMKGEECPSFIRPRLRGWGTSIIEHLVRSINQYLKSNDLGFEVLDEFKIDIYKIKNLVQTLLSPQGKEKVRERIQLANWQKNYQNAVVMDAEDDWDHKQLSFAGLADAVREIRVQVASDMRMPMIKLFGQQASNGLGATGEDEIEVYNSMVESSVRNKIKYPVLRICEIKCQKLFGFVPDDLTVAWKPLRVLTSEGEQKVKDSKWTRIQQAAQMGLISAQEARDAANKSELFDIKLVGAAPTLSDETTDGGSDPYDDEDTDDPGTNRSDSDSPRATDRGGAPKGGKQKGLPKAYPTKSTAKTGTGRTSNVRSISEHARFVNDHPIRPFPKRRMVTLNSAEFDKASYMADGGDAWIDPRRKVLFDDPPGIDHMLWARAKEAARKSLGEERWQFAVWWYRKQGGRFDLGGYQA